MEKTTESLDKQNLLMLLKRYAVQHDSIYHLVPTRFLMETFRILKEDCEGTKIGFEPAGSDTYNFHCGKCGEQVFLKDGFCRGCGTPLNWPEGEPKPEPGYFDVQKDG